MTDSLKVNFCGVDFPNPFILSSSPVTNSAEMILRAYELGWGSAVYKTLMYDKGTPAVNVTPRLAQHQYEDKQMVGLQNIELITDRPLDDNLKDIQEIKKNFPDRPLIVSIMAEQAEKDWQELTRLSEEAGGDMIELNFSCPHGMPEKGLGAAIGQVPEVTQQITSWVKAVAKTPVIVKLTPNITDMRIPARAAKAGGADALSAINTIRCLTGINLETFEPIPTVSGKSTFGGYSGPAVKPIALRFIAEMASDPQLGLPLSGMGGLTTWEHAAEFLLVGASTLQVTTAVMRFGYRIISDLTEGLADWMEEHEFESIDEIVGKSLPNIVTHTELPRDYRVVSSVDREKCVKDDMCYVSCQDGGHQAITLDENRLPLVDEEKCVGCGLCREVCPVWDCISMKVISGGAGA